MGKIKELAKTVGKTLYRFGIDARIPLSSVYKFDGHPELLTIGQANRCAEIAHLTDAEYGKWARSIGPRLKKSIKSKTA